MGAFLADHNGGRVGISGDDVGHDRTVGDAQPLDAMHPKSFIDNGARIASHPAGGGRMEDCVALLPGIGQQGFIGCAVVARFAFRLLIVRILCGAIVLLRPQHR